MSEFISLFNALFSDLIEKIQVNKRQKLSIEDSKKNIRLIFMSNS